MQSGGGCAVAREVEAEREESSGRGFWRKRIQHGGGFSWRGFERFYVDKVQEVLSGEDSGGRGF